VWLGSEIAQARWGIRVTLPALMQLVQAFTRVCVPLTKARTRWMFGSQRRLFRLCENVTDLPKNGFFPQISQTAAMASRGYQSCPYVRPYGSMRARLDLSTAGLSSPSILAT
jgi:hypothetical protein